MMSSPSPARVLDSVAKALAEVQPVDEHVAATLGMCVVVLTNLRTRISKEAGWQAEESSAIESFAAALADATQEPTLTASVAGLRARGPEPEGNRYDAASDVLCTAISVIAAGGHDRFVPELERLLRTRVAHEMAITGDAF